MGWIKKRIKPLLTHPQVATGLCRIFMKLDNRIDRWTNELLVYAGGGVHPKHRLMAYAQFFIDRTGAQDRVLDIGCGRGMVAYAIAEKASAVTGIDFNQKNIDFADSTYRRPNLRFICGDALTHLTGETYDVIILSSVLEHIEDRPAFLRQIRGLAPRALIRVPLIDRDWLPLLKREWGIDFRLDDTHFTEYTVPEFQEELRAGGWTPKHLSIQFGEIWAVADSGSVQ
jgi:SAM-dependent methyltransferase